MVLAHVLLLPGVPVDVPGEVSGRIRWPRDHPEHCGAYSRCSGPVAGCPRRAHGDASPDFVGLWARRKSPTLATAQRILAAAGFDLVLSPRVEFREVVAERGRPVMVPDVLPRLRLDQALATVALPLHLNGSDRSRRFDLRKRRERARVYELVLRDGVPADILTYLDGPLLVDLWDELILPAGVRSAWNGRDRHCERASGLMSDHESPTALQVQVACIFFDLDAQRSPQTQHKVRGSGSLDPDRA